MEYEHHQPIVYLDHMAVGLFLDTSGVVEHYRTALARLDTVAASEVATRAFLLAQI